MAGTRPAKRTRLYGPGGLGTPPGAWDVAVHLGMSVRLCLFCFVFDLHVFVFGTSILMVRVSQNVAYLASYL